MPRQFRLSASLRPSVIRVYCRGGFNGRPLVQWLTGPLALEAPGVGPARRTMEVALSL